jgi:Leucine-rich repeat (LRR) protein
LAWELPQYFAFFHDLRALSLGYNNLHGCIPQHITNLTNLQVLDLSNNKFSGRIPIYLERLSGFANVSKNEEIYQKMEIDMKGHEYTLSYLLPTNIILDLSSNNLTGKIPASIGRMSHLRLLNLSRNQLEGRIPTSLSGISTLEQLDLAKNNLSGPIPEELSKLHELVVLDVSSNNLCGRIPTGTQFSTFNVSSFQNNKCLWGCPLDSCNENERQARKCDNATKSSNVRVGWLSHVDENMSLIALGLGMGIGFGGVVAIFVFWERAKHWVLSPIMPRPFFGVYRFPT